MDGDLGLLYFGRDDAEMDIAEGGLLHAGFLRTAAYDAVRTSRKHLIIGRKGSGKSAICRTLVTDTDPSLVTALVAQGNTEGYADFAVLSRGPVESRLVDSSSGYAREMLMKLHESGLPAEISTDLSARMFHIIQVAEGMRAYPGLNMADAVQYATEVAEFLDQMSDTLERSGFAGTEKARYFIRRASEVSRRLRREAVVGFER